MLKKMLLLFGFGDKPFVASRTFDSIRLDNKIGLSSQVIQSNYDYDYHSPTSCPKDNTESNDLFAYNGCMCSYQEEDISDLQIAKNEIDNLITRGRFLPVIDLGWTMAAKLPENLVLFELTKRVDWVD